MDAELTARRLDAFNHWRLSPALSLESWDHAQQRALEDLELEFVTEEREKVRELAARAPTTAPELVAWFEELEASGPGQHDPLFDWLEHTATKDEMTWFLRQEVAGEAGFDDLVALTQVKLPNRPKLELARNYWDEMGQGTLRGMHGPMLARLADELGIARDSSDDIVWESLALANLMVALAKHPALKYQSVGALGAIELTAPGRAAKVNRGLRRLGIDGNARQYFALHATLDVKHSIAWNREALGPLVEGDSRIAPLIAEGALMRLAAGARCFERYRAELGTSKSSLAA